MNTKAPLLLFGFLGVMVFCIIASVMLAIKNPVKEDDSYFSSKRQIDEEINLILKEQKEFSKLGNFYLGCDHFPRLIKQNELRFPYLQKRDDVLKLKSSKQQHLFLAFEGRKPNDLSISLYLEKINSFDPKISLGKIDIGIPKSLPKLNAGRYKAIFEVTYLREGEKRRIFFEKELFAL